MSHTRKISIFGLSFPNFTGSENKKMNSLGMIVLVGFFLACSQFLCGCDIVFTAVLDPLMPHYNTVVAQTDLPELTHCNNVIAMASGVGRSMGCDISLQTDDCVILLYDTPELEHLAIGKFKSIQIFVYKVKAGRNFPLPISDQSVIEKIEPPPLKGETVRLVVYGYGVGQIGNPLNMKKCVNVIMQKFENKLLAKALGR